MAIWNDESNQSAHQRAYRFIREHILDGTYVGGTKLKPAKIALELNVSRMPVREALVQLDAEGLVVMRPNRGAIVTLMTVDNIEELFQMRAALEGLAAQRAVKKITAAHKEELRALIVRMQNVSSASPHLWLKLHDEFHELLCSIGEWPRLAAEIQKIRNAVRPYLLFYNNVYHETEMQGAEHEGLLMALDTRNEILVRDVVTNHILSAGTGVLEWLRTFAKPGPAMGTIIIDFNSSGLRSQGHSAKTVEAE